MNETIAFSGRIGEVVHITQASGRVFEQYRRPPGVRLIILSKDGKILITKETRAETNSIDYRLPGGKVCDTLETYRQVKAEGANMNKLSEQAAIKEALEETGLIIKQPQFLVKAIDGATVEWDLYYYLVTDYERNQSGQQLEHGEDIDVTWLTPTEIRQAISDGKMQEWRSVGVLLGLVLPMLEQH